MSTKKELRRITVIDEDDNIREFRERDLNDDEEFSARRKSKNEIKFGIPKRIIDNLDSPILGEHAVLSDCSGKVLCSGEIYKKYRLAKNGNYRYRVK